MYLNFSLSRVQKFLTYGKIPGLRYLQFTGLKAVLKNSTLKFDFLILSEPLS